MRLLNMPFLTLILSLLLTFNAQAKTAAPFTIYKVKQGDTLWKIATRLLGDPLEWPLLWNQLMVQQHDKSNPNLIYPGDRISLTWQQQKLHLQIHQHKVSSPPSAPIVLFSNDLVNAFIPQGRIVRKELITNAPRLINKQNSWLRSGDLIYTQGLFDPALRYGIYQQGVTYHNAETGEVLGVELALAGYSRVAHPTVMMPKQKGLTVQQLTQQYREIQQGDIVLPAKRLLPQSPPSLHSLSPLIKGHIIAFQHHALAAGINELVTLDKGARENVHVGSVLAVMAQPFNNNTQLSPRAISKTTQIATLVAVQVYHKVSVALVMHAKVALHLNDIIQGMAVSDQSTQLNKHRTVKLPKRG